MSVVYSVEKRLAGVQDIPDGKKTCSEELHSSETCKCCCVVQLSMTTHNVALSYAESRKRHGSLVLRKSKGMIPSSGSESCEVFSFSTLGAGYWNSNTIT